MSGKGSGRRPQQESEEQVNANWARIFGKQDNPPAEPESKDKESNDEQ